ncbi:MAG TPA: SPOR domain-containing protein [Bacteroidales bacterium]|nr:SPOR domain-containing protein [Bacteroidales bacterium]
MAESEFYNELKKLVVDLLPANECVIIPGLGGFITYKVSARINNAFHQIYPPAAKVGFNAALKANDGLLATHFAIQNGITYAQALEKIQEFAWHCISQLNDGKILNFPSIGDLQLDDSKNLIFNPDPHSNFLDDAFGLTPVSAVPIRRKYSTTPSSAPAEKRSQRFRSRNLVEGLKWTVMILPILLLAMYSIYQTGFLQGIVDYSSLGGNVPQSTSSIDVRSLENPSPSATDLFTQRKSKLRDDPFQNSESAFVDTTLPVIVLHSDIAPSPSSIENLKDYLKDTPIDVETEKEKFTENNIAATSVSETITSENAVKFYVIAGCFKEIDNAYRLLNQLKQKGFNAQLAGTSSKGLTRVAIASFASESEANNALESLKRKSSQDLWILKM